MKKYARQCDITGQGMNAGFCIGDGAMYIKSEKHMSEHITNDTEYASMEEAYEDDYYYWTEWEDEDDFQHWETPANASAEFLRNMVAWMNRRPETLNDGKTIDQLIMEYKKAEQ